MSRNKIIIVFVSILFAVSMFFTVGCGRPGPAEKKETTEKGNKKDVGQKKEEKDTDAVPVQVTSPVRGNISSFLLFSSNVDSEKMVDIYPLTSGIIEKIDYYEGDKVKKGTVLAILDDREASINESKARINYEQLKVEFDRQEEIYKKDLISKEDYERLRFRKENASLEWKQAKLLLSYTRITSPIAGVVTKRHIKAGNKITTVQLAFSVVNVKEKIAVVNIPGQEREHLYLKQKSIILAGDRQVPGFVKRISPAIDPESGTFKVTVEVKDPGNLLAVGQFVNVKIIKKVHRDVILLTKEALIYDGGKIFVFVIDEENQASKKLIQTGFEDGTRVEVMAGLSDKDRVVTAGKSSLKNKTLVKIIEPIVS
ncbi:MAG: efflux RND transporter periplasmic adaptor subunit [Candidatus Aminicenantes bacterium]|nr:efflux RND transporter periplasmic adaptor subunit [Candidatus Aminicenantes bacterium]